MKQSFPQHIFDDLKTYFSFKKFSACSLPNTDDLETVTRYVWNITLCESFYPLLQNLEIGFRNGMNRAITNYFSDDLWLVNHLTKLSSFDKASILKAQAELTKQQKPLEAGRLIAELHFGFWTGLLTRRYEQVFWNKPKIYADAFPNLPLKIRNRNFLTNRFHQIRLFRNRVFHHERILHQNLPAVHNSILDTIGFFSRNALKTTKIIDRFPIVFSKDYFDKLKNDLGKI